VLLSHTFDLILTFQVKRASGGSNETMRHLEYHVRTGTGGTLRDRRTLNTIALA
jgi:hypothetical protein